MKPARIVTLGLVLFLVAACGDDDGGTDADGAVLTSTTDVAPPVDLAEGAFERNDGTETVGGESPDGGSSSSDPALTPESGTAASQEIGPDATEATTSVAASDDTETSEDREATTASGGSTSDTTAPGTTPGTTPATTAGATTIDPAAIGPMQGFVLIGDVDYPFTADSCEFDVGQFDVVGFGTSSAGDPFEVTILFESFDFDDDGVDELSLDLYIDPDVPTGVDLATLPEFYASKVQDGDFSEGVDITVAIDGAMITGAGPITDFNGVASAVDRPLPMTFEARCA